MNKKAVILFSGGLDSTTVLAIAIERGFSPCTLSIDYGQRHKIELVKAQEMAKTLNIFQHKEIAIDLSAIGGSALTDRDIAVPVNRNEESMSENIPVTYVPARNTIFLSLALSYAETLGSEDLFIGVNALDYSGYPDCRPEFIESFEKLAQLATQAGVEKKSRFKIHTPLINMSKAEIIKEGLRLGVDYSKTHSCYNPDDSGSACGLCDSCLLREKGFAAVMEGKG